MAALEWPEDVFPASLTWRPESNTKTFRSPFNGSSQTARFPGTRWVCSLTFNNLTDEKSRRIDALVASLDGEYGRVKVRDWGEVAERQRACPLLMALIRQGPRFKVRDGRREQWCSDRAIISLLTMN